MTPAMRYKKRIEAEQAAAKQKALEAHQEAERQKLLPDKQEKYNLAMAGLALDLKRLKDLPKIEDKITLKKELLPDYLAFVDEYLASGEEYNNEIFVRVIIWLLDVGEVQKALAYADIAIKQKQPTPFKSNIETFVADNVFDWAERCLRDGKDYEPHFSKVYDQLAHWPVHDAVQAKYEKFRAQEAEAAGDDAKALEHYNRAFELGAQVKTARDKCVKRIKKAAEDKK